MYTYYYVLMTIMFSINGTVIVHEETVNSTVKDYAMQACLNEVIRYDNFYGEDLISFSCKHAGNSNDQK